jgi:glucose-1-phosphate thymidylyltransferase
LSDELIGLIPAAGKGLRLGLPYPKELYPIIHDNRYKPVSQYILENLTASGVEHIVFVINDTKHQLIGYFGDGSRFGCHISYVVQEVREDNQGSTSPGLAHALDAAYHLVRGKTVLFGMADTIISPKNVFEVILNKSDPADEVILGLFYTPRPEKGGMVEYEESGRVVHLKYTWGIIAGRPRFTEFLHDSLRSKGIVDFAQVMNTAIAAGLNFRAVHTNGSYSDLGTYEEIIELEKQYRAP